jgi:hypothetical protein
MKLLAFAVTGSTAFKSTLVAEGAQKQQLKRFINLSLFLL